MKNIKPNKLIIAKILKYEKKYKEIIVTYHDGKSLSFTPTKWATFEKGIRNVAKEINFVPLYEKKVISKLNIFQRIIKYIKILWAKSS